jgi:hypothetical protein
MDDIINFNRRTLSGVKQWITRSDWETPPSIFNYGLPNSIFHLIDLPINETVTEVDMICKYLGEFPKINYLEIGVSVGKTFYQVIKYAAEHFNTNVYKSFSCIDIEKINPTLEKLFDDMYGNKSVTLSNTDDTNVNSIRKQKNNFVTVWDNHIRYYEADEFDKNIWTTMNTQYNFIFSDAYHAPHALINEYTNIKNNNLLDPEGFIYCFDDLESYSEGPMWKAVKQISHDIQTQYPQFNVTVEHLNINGWIGQHESKHNFGVIKCFPRK